MRRSQNSESNRSYNIFLKFSWIVVGMLSLLLIESSNFKPIQRSLFKKSVSSGRTLKYWGISISQTNPNGNLRTMNRVFQRLGYEFFIPKGDDWDVLWSMEYPFPYKMERHQTFDPLNKPIKQHQRINHFPGIACILNKAIMTTNNQDLEFILPTFRYPNETEKLKAYIARKNS